MTQLLPATQPVTDSVEIDQDFPPVDFENPWGRFYPLHINIPSYINLTQSEFTVGRDYKCDYTLTAEELGEKIYQCVSKVQFKVARAELPSGVFITLITDLSSNGTFINGKCIGRNQTSVLSTNDNIAVAVSTNNVFVYTDLGEPLSEIPDEITKNYAICNVLGKGGYGEVRLVFKKDTTARYAMKQINIEPTEKKRIIDVFNEVKILRRLKHEHVVEFHNMSLIENEMYLFLEYMHGGDLANFVRKRNFLPEDIAKHIYRQILLGTNYLHSNKVVHRDLKPANILLSSDSNHPRVKITDFGLSKILDSSFTLVRTRCGTTSFAPPELQFASVSSSPQTYDFRADVWSLGVILYYCLSGILPFRKDRGDIPFERQIRNANYSFDGEAWGNVSPRPFEIIRKCLVRNPDKRCYVEELLKDDWFKDEEPICKRLNQLGTSRGSSHEPPMKKLKR